MEEAAQVDEGIEAEILTQGYDLLIRVVNATATAEEGLNNFSVKLDKIVTRSLVLRRVRRRPAMTLTSTIQELRRIIDDCSTLLKGVETISRDFSSAAAWIFFSYGFRRSHTNVPTESWREAEALKELREMPTLMAPAKVSATELLDLVNSLPKNPEVDHALAVLADGLRNFIHQIDAVFETAATTEAMILRVRFESPATAETGNQA